MLHNVGLVATDTSRTRAYLTALEKYNLLPRWVLLLDDNSDENKQGRFNLSTDQLPKKNKTRSMWDELFFDPTFSIIGWLERLNIEYVKSSNKDINSPKVIELVANCVPSVLIYSGYGGALLRDEVLNVGKRFLHVHGGYLPDYKGSTTNYYSLLKEGRIGASSIFLSAEIDSGPVLVRRNFCPPAERKDIDHIYDSIVRSQVLVETLLNYQECGDWVIDDVDNKAGDTYYIIHPVLKHIAILGDARSRNSENSKVE